MAPSQTIATARGATTGPLATLRSLRHASLRSASGLLHDIGRALLEVSHNALALLGLALAALIVFAVSRPDLRHDAERWALGWLQQRHEPRAQPAPPTSFPMAPLAPFLSATSFTATPTLVPAAQPAVAAVSTAPVEPAQPGAVARATASDPRNLDRQQAAVAQWIARRYRVAPEPVSRLVQEAWSVGRRSGLDPTLILAIMAIESSFNPFAQSDVGAQGLMQVMTKMHNDKYQAFGGNHAAFDPVTNLRVGVQVLKECISRAGSLEAGLKFYVGAANLPDDGGYAGKVLNEQNSLRLVASGKTVPVRGTPAQAAAPTVVKTQAAAAPASPTPRPITQRDAPPAAALPAAALPAATLSADSEQIALAD